MVKKAYLFCCIIVMIVFFAGGNERLSSAYECGQKAGNDFLRQHDGADEEYERTVFLTTICYQISGGIIAAIGGIGIIVFSYALSKEFSKK